MSSCPISGPLAVGICGHSICFNCLPALGLRATCPHCQMEGAFILGKKNYLVEELVQYMARPRTAEEEENLSKILAENVQEAESELANLEEEYRRLLAVSEERRVRESQRQLERPLFWRLGAERRPGGQAEALDQLVEQRMEERARRETARRLENQLRRPDIREQARQLVRQGNQQLEELAEQQRLREEHRHSVQRILEESRVQEQRHRELLRQVGQGALPGFFGGQQIHWNGSFNQNTPRHQMAVQPPLTPIPVQAFTGLQNTAYILPNAGNPMGQAMQPRGGQNYQ